MSIDDYYLDGSNDEDIYDRLQRRIEAHEERGLKRGKDRGQLDYFHITYGQYEYSSRVYDKYVRDYERKMETFSRNGRLGQFVDVFHQLVEFIIRLIDENIDE